MSEQPKTRPTERGGFMPRKKKPTQDFIMVKPSTVRPGRPAAPRPAATIPAVRPWYLTGSDLVVDAAVGSVAIGRQILRHLVTDVVVLVLGAGAVADRVRRRLGF